jgi:hypothetical protein
MGPLTFVLPLNVKIWVLYRHSGASRNPVFFKDIPDPGFHVTNIRDLLRTSLNREKGSGEGDRVFQRTYRP